MNDLISVIVPVYKVEEYLKRCINSILRQTYRNLEIILINDGSPDSCGEICNEFAKNDNRVKVIHKDNGGLSDARNAGIEIANGDYLTFIDSDDWINEKYIEKLHELIIETHADIASCNYLETDGSNKFNVISDIKTYSFTNLEALEQLTGKYYLQLVVSTGKIYKRFLFEDIRYPFGKIHEDEFVAHHVIYKANKIVMTTEQLYYYYQRDDSITGRGFNVKGKLHSIQALEDRAKLLDKLHLTKSRDIVYKNLFHFYRQIIECNKNDEDMVSFNKSNFIRDYNELRVKLRRGNYKLNRKIFYELYYVIPNVMKQIHKIYQKVK